MLSNDNISHIICNGPVPVNFAGLRGTTRSMQANGWQISADVYRDAYRDGTSVSLAGRHTGLGLYFISNRYRMDREFLIRASQTGPASFDHINFDIRACAEAIQFDIPHGGAPPSFKAVDFSNPIPTTMDLSREISLQECSFFKTFNEDTEIYVPSDQIWTMEKHLKAIRDSQKDKQAELRAKYRKNTERLMNERGRNTDIDKNDAQKGNIKLQLVAV